MGYLSNTWTDLQWTPWISFKGSKLDWFLLPEKPGLYRVKPENSGLIAYIGETGRGLRDRLNSLRRGTLSELMPFNDPHTAAPNLWAWRQEEHWKYECSVAPFNRSSSERKATECLLLWKYRLEKGESTLCNHGRFHKNYTKSTNRSKNKRGGRLQEPRTNESWGPSYPPLKLKNEPLDNNWMGLKWEDKIPLKKEEANHTKDVPALYKIIDAKANKILYIGETTELRNRFLSHCRSFSNFQLAISFSEQPHTIKEYQLHEMENDLIAGYFAQTTQVPIYQFSNAGSSSGS